MPNAQGQAYATPRGQAYEKYINSKAWARKRRAYWKLHGRVCQVPGCDATVDLHVHHHTYERLENERMSDLVGLCKRHHDEVHDLYDEKRGALSLTRATELVTGLDLGHANTSSHPLAGTTATAWVEQATKIKRKSPAKAKVKKVRRQKKTVAELEVLHARTPWPKGKCHCRSCEPRRKEQEAKIGRRVGPLDTASIAMQPGVRSRSRTKVRKRGEGKRRAREQVVQRRADLTQRHEMAQEVARRIAAARKS